MATEEELKARLKRQADEVVERVIRERKPSGKNSLEDIEGLAIEAGRSFREQVLQELAAEESEAAEAVYCEGCGHRMESRGKRQRAVVSRAGEVRVDRRSYRCPQCGKRSFPPG
jgi:uncharacterized protein with PIN domain